MWPISGLVCLIWFLIRVIPKPSRAAYPCQRAAFPLASGFIVWLLGLSGSILAYHKAKRALAQTRYVLVVICLAASIGFIWSAVSSTDQKITYAHEPPVANSPLGEAKGVHPGRVAWIHDPNATNWAGPGSGERWYSDACTDQQVVNEMLSKALRALIGESSDYAAWDAIFRNFNQQRGKGDVGYSPGEKIAIKTNFVLMYSNPASGNKPSALLDRIDDSPQLAIALLKQLTEVVGVSPGDISIGDPLMIMPNYWYNMVESNCPGVVYLSKKGYHLNGRTEVALDYTAPFFWSDPNTSRWQGKTQDYIPTHFAQANYFINFPVLKSHNDGGITLSGKNHFGSLMRGPNAYGYYDMHVTRATETPGMGHYRAIVDLMGHPKLGGKTLLVLIDGLFAGISWDSTPVKWQMTPFNNDWPSSIFASQDQVAADSVADDFLYTEWDDAPTDYPHKSGADDYLHEAALANNPPSGAFYDPNHSTDVQRLASLGVHEHWNNPIDKKYSRNLGTGDGIELVTQLLVRGDFDSNGNIDMNDFAVLANAWHTCKGDADWNSACDISIASDNTIDMLDLAVFIDNWLWEEE